MTDENQTQPYTVVNIGKGQGPVLPEKTATKPINEMTLLDWQKACAAYFAKNGFSG